MTEAAPTTLADLRGEIDRIDSAMHALLMERSQVIETLISIKKTQASGSAFRPGREADIMKRLALSHKGLLPLDTVESVWRIIIATFTYVQANYSVHADTSGGDPAMRDSARFHFGFTVPFVTHEDARAVIRAVAESAGDLGIFRMDQGASAGIWWRDLIGADAPKIIARLPFVERPNHPAGTPVYCIAKPLADAAVREIVLYAARVERWSENLRQGLAEHLAEVSASAADGSPLAAGRGLRRGRPGYDPPGPHAGGFERLRRNRQPRRPLLRQIRPLNGLASCCKVNRHGVPSRPASRRPRYRGLCPRQVRRPRRREAA